MCRTFQIFQQLLHIVVVQSRSQPELARSDDERLSRRALGRHQAEAKKVIDHLLERSTGAAALLLEQPGHIIIEG